MTVKILLQLITIRSCYGNQENNRTALQILINYCGHYFKELSLLIIRILTEMSRPDQGLAVARCNYVGQDDIW